MMTRQDYKVIAKILSQHISEIDLIFSFMDVFEADNPKFNRKLFLAASMKVDHHPFGGGD